MVFDQLLSCPPGSLLLPEWIETSKARKTGHLVRQARQAGRQSGYAGLGRESPGRGCVRQLRETGHATRAAHLLLHVGELFGRWHAAAKSKHLRHLAHWPALVG